MCKIKVLILIGIFQLVGANVDSPFSLDTEELHLKEISDAVRNVSGAVMGLSETMVEMNSNLKAFRAEMASKLKQLNDSTPSRPISYYSSSKPLRDPIEFRKQSLMLADKVEKLLAMDQSPEVDLVKEELKRTVEKNFLRMLAAILVTGPVHTQQRSDDIFKLMRSVLNGELDFTPVVQRLPFILRDSETNQFVNLLITLRESERAQAGAPARARQDIFASLETTAGAGRQIPSIPIPSSPSASNSNSRLSGPNRPQNRPSYNFQNRYNNNYNRYPPNYNNGNPSGNNFQGQSQNYHPQNNNYGPPSGNNYPPPNPNGNNFSPQNNNFQGNNFQPQGNNYQPQNQNSNNNNQQQNAPPPPPPAANNNKPSTYNNEAGAGAAATTPGTPGANGMQQNQLPTINSLIDAMSQTNQLIKELPTLIEGLQTLIDSIEGAIG